MAEGVKYLIMTLIFLAIMKLLQVTSFDGKEYDTYEKKLEKKNIVKSPPKKSTSPSNKKSPKKKNSKSPKKKESTAEFAGENILSSLISEYLTPIMKNLPPDGLRKDIFIRYYRHHKDGVSVYKLEEMGYYMHQKPATETAGLGSNTIYYGDDVPLEDIQIVTLTLLREGIPIKTIKHTKFEWKSSAIEIGTDISIPEDQPNISLEEIVDFHKQYLGRN